MVDFRVGVQKLNEIGFVDTVLPFFLVFSLVYAILEKSGILYKESEDKENQSKTISLIISMIMGFFAILSLNFLDWTKEIIGTGLIIMLVVFSIMILLGLTFGKDYKLLFRIGGKEENGLNVKLVGSIAFVLVFAVAYFTFDKLGVIAWFLEKSEGSGDTFSDMFWTIIFFVIFLGTIALMSKEENSNKESKELEKND